MFTLFSKQDFFSSLIVYGFEMVSPRRMSIVLNAKNKILSEEQQLELRISRLRRKMHLLKKDHERQQAFFAVAKQLINLARKRKYYAVIRKLSQPELWTNYSQLVPCSRESLLEAYCAKWALHGKYAAFTTPQLLQLYMQTLPIFAQWLAQAKLEFQRKGHHLPAPLNNTYADYLNACTEVLAYERAAIRASLLARVQAGIKQQDLSYDDIVTHTLRWLDLLSIKSSIRIKFTHTRRTIDPFAFAAIQNILEQDGLEADKKEFSNLINKSNNPKEHLIKRENHLGRIFWVPQVMDNIVPMVRPIYTYLPIWLHWLFPLQRIPYEFFQNEQSQYLLITEQIWTEELINYYQLSIEEKLASSVWQQFQELFAIVHAERCRCEQAERSLILFNPPATKEIFNYYKNFLNALAEKVLQKEILALEAMIYMQESDSGFTSPAHAKYIAELLDLAFDHCLLEHCQYRTRLNSLYNYTKSLFSTDKGCSNHSQEIKNVPSISEQVSIEKESVRNQASAATLSASINRLEPFVEIAGFQPIILPSQAQDEQLNEKMSSSDIEELLVWLINIEDAKDRYCNPMLGYQAINCLINCLFKLSSVEAYLPKQCSVQRILIKIEAMAEGDVLLENILNMIKMALAQLDSMDWEFFIEYKIQPLAKALANSWKQDLLPSSCPRLAASNLSKVRTTSTSGVLSQSSLFKTPFMVAKTQSTSYQHNNI